MWSRMLKNFSKVLPSLIIDLAPLPANFGTFLHSIEGKNASILNFRQNIREIKIIKTLLIDARRHLELQELEEH